MSLNISLDIRIYFKKSTTLTVILALGPVHGDVANQ